MKAVMRVNFISKNTYLKKQAITNNDAFHCLKENQQAEPHINKWKKTI